MISSTGNKGFTLLELMLVAVILGVAATLVVPNFTRTAAHLELRKATEDLAYTLRYGQLQAISKGHFLRLNTDEKGYWLEESRTEIENENPGTNPVFEKIHDRWGRRTNFPAGIKLTQESKDITCSPDGRITLSSLRLCRGEECLLLSTGKQHGRVEIVEMKGTNEHALQ